MSKNRSRKPKLMKRGWVRTFVSRAKTIYYPFDKHIHNTRGLMSMQPVIVKLNANKKGRQKGYYISEYRDSVTSHDKIGPFDDFVSAEACYVVKYGPL